MLTYILLGIAVLVVLFIIVVARQPNDFRVTRSTTISAPPQAVFERVNDFHNWEAWSPWAKMDLACQYTYAGAPAGTGASFSWAGNKKVGAGRMTLLESQPGQLLRIKLEFFKPFKAINTTEFTFQSEGQQTVVTWSMFGKNNFMGKALGLIMNYDKMVGGDFERGLASLKSVVEKAGKI